MFSRQLTSPLHDNECWELQNVNILSSHTSSWLSSNTNTVKQLMSQLLKSLLRQLQVLWCCNAYNSFCFWIRIVFLVRICFSPGSLSPIYSHTRLDWGSAEEPTKILTGIIILIQKHKLLCTTSLEAASGVIMHVWEYGEPEVMPISRSSSRPCPALGG